MNCLQTEEEDLRTRRRAISPQRLQTAANCSLMRFHVNDFVFEGGENENTHDTRYEDSVWEMINKLVIELKGRERPCLSYTEKIDRNLQPIVRKPSIETELIWQKYYYGPR